MNASQENVRQLRPGITGWQRGTVEYFFRDSKVWRIKLNESGLKVYVSTATVQAAKLPDLYTHEQVDCQVKYIGKNLIVIRIRLLKPHSVVEEGLGITSETQLEATIISYNLQTGIGTLQINCNRKMVMFKKEHLLAAGIPLEGDVVGAPVRVRVRSHPRAATRPFQLVELYAV